MLANGPLPSLFRLRVGAMLAVGFAALASTARAQTGTVAAVITDRTTSLPLEAVRIQVGTSQIGALTDSRGHALVRGVPVGAQTLRFTRIGYRVETQTVTVPSGDSARVSITMTPSAVELSTVVTTGTGGAVEKRQVGASLATVDVSSLNEVIPGDNLQSLLANKVTGVRSVGVGGGVGQGQDLRIRGIASFGLNQRPAVYIDGVRVDTKAEDWSNIANVACCAFTGGNSVDRMSDINPDDIDHIEVLKGAAAATLYGSEATNGVIQIFTKRGRGADQRTAWSLSLGSGFDRLRENLPTTLFPKFTGPDGTVAKDANGLIQSGPYNAADLSAQGGTQRSTYYASGSLSKETGSIQPNDQLKGALRLNLAFLPSDKWTVESRSSYVRDYVHDLQAGNNWTALLGNAMNGNPRTATAARPYGEAWVPVADIERMQTTDDTDRWTGGLTINYQMFPALSHRLTIGLDAVNSQKQRFFPFDGSYGPAGVTLGQKDIGFRDFKSYTFDYLASLKFKLPFGIDSDLGAGGQGFWQNERLEFAVGNQFPGPGVNTVSSAATTNGAELYTETINLGFLAQNRFSWRDKVFSTVGIRVDGNSAFGKNYGFQRYPKIDLSYDMTKDGFLPALISSARIRGAIGEAGKMPGPFDSFTSYAASPVFTTGSGIIPSNPGNADLRPETSLEKEIGFEAGLWKDRIGLEGSLYRQKTSDAIVPVFNPPSAGFVNAKSVNLGAIENHGWEGSVNYLVIQHKRFEWTTGIKVDGNNNKVTDLGGLVLGGNAIRLGYPVQGVWDRIPTGFSKVNGQPVTTRSDTAVYLGPPLPTFNGSLTNTVRIGKLQFYGMLSMEHGAVFGNGDRAYRIRQGGADEWLKLLGPGGTPTFASDSLYQYAGILNFNDSRNNVRLRELSVSYELPDGLTHRANLGRSTITFSGQNLMWWDHCHCVDPNMNWDGANSFTIGNGFLAQPSPRLFRVQVRTKF